MINYELTNIDNINHILEIKYISDEGKPDYYVNTNVPKEFTEETLHQIAQMNAFQASQFWFQLSWFPTVEPFVIANPKGQAKPTIYEERPKFDEGLQTITPVVIETEEAYVRTFEVRDFTAEELSDMIRMKRNALLDATDKYAMPDRKTPPEILAYRQALRDITSQPNFPYNIVWPIRPVE